MVHFHWQSVKIHTTKCDICNQHNKDVCYRCVDCGVSTCIPCKNNGGSFRGHALPYQSVSVPARDPAVPPTVVCGIIVESSGPKQPSAAAVRTKRYAAQVPRNQAPPQQSTRVPSASLSLERKRQSPPVQEPRKRRAIKGSPDDTDDESFESRGRPRKREGMTSERSGSQNDPDLKARVADFLILAEPELVNTSARTGLDLLAEAAATKNPLYTQLRDRKDNNSQQQTPSLKVSNMNPENASKQPSYPAEASSTTGNMENEKGNEITPKQNAPEPSTTPEGSPKRTIDLTGEDNDATPAASSANTALASTFPQVPIAPTSQTTLASTSQAPTVGTSQASLYVLIRAMVREDTDLRGRRVHRILWLTADHLEEEEALAMAPDNQARGP